MKNLDFVAIYAAVLSTIHIIWTIRSETPKVNVKIVNGFDRVDSEVIDGIYIIVQNSSKHSLNISNILILIPQNKSLMQRVKSHLRFKNHVRFTWAHSSLANYGLNAGCPLKLEPGKSHSVFIPEQTLNLILKDSTLKEIACVVQDEVRKPKYSKKYKL